MSQSQSPPSDLEKAQPPPQLLPAESGPLPEEDGGDDLSFLGEILDDLGVSSRGVLLQTATLVIASAFAVFAVIMDTKTTARPNCITGLQTPCHVDICWSLNLRPKFCK